MKKLSPFRVVCSLILISLVTGVVFMNTINRDKNTETKVATFNENKIISMDGRKMSYLSVDGSYENIEIYTSDIKVSDFNFTSAGISWDELTPENTEVNLEIRLKQPKGWTNWIKTEIEEDDFYENESGFEKKYAIISTDIADEMQYRFILHGAQEKSPVIKNIEYTFINTGKTVEYSPLPSAIYFSDIGPGISFGFSELTPIISRQQWGANESHRYLANNTTPSQVIEMSPDYYERFKAELQYSRIVEADENGNRYKWPLQYPEEVKKIIVHHSATTGNLNNPAQAVRDIYHYHAVTRGWGDIGYNYVLDLSGRVYEGRYGGEGVIGAHAGPGNHGSIGIMILGNYQNAPAPEVSVVAMSKLIYEKSKIHGFNPDGHSMFRGKVQPNIMGHRDVMSTQCPGDFLYEKLPVIRVLASKSFEEKEKFVKDYDFQNKSNIFYIELKPEEKRQITIKFENIGKVNWNNETFIVVEDNRDIEGVLYFPTKQGVVLAKMEESVVRPGEVGTFKFEMEAGRRGRTVQIKIVPLINGTNKLKDHIIIPITVQQPFYKYEYVSGNLPPSTMEAGTNFSGTVTIRNTGNVSWENSGENAIILKDAVGLIRANLVQGIVRPGETGTFNFTFKAPSMGGSYNHNLKAEIRGINFNSPPNINFSTTVFAREYDGEIVSRSITNNFAQGASYNLSMQIRNIGMKEWNSNSIKLAVMRSADIQIRDLVMQPRTVKTGEIADISFRVNVSEDAELGDRLMTVRAIMNNRSMNLVPAVFTYLVKEKQTVVSDNKEPTIRVKLSFEGDPEVSANSGFDVYSGDKHIRTMNAGETITVTREAGKYRVLASGVNLLEDNPIRIIPQNSGIVKIENYENRPTWNPSLNDNEYRGLIEVREENGKLIAINELLMEDYLKGLAEVPNAEEPEKIKSIMIAARTYAKYYIIIDQKFPGKPYHLDDNPDVTQKYIGYGFEKRAPNVVAGINSTRGIVVTYDGKLVKTPYFNQSDGVRTKSAREVWGWTNTPYLQSVDDSYCDGGGFLGHGVGMSGCGAHGMAKQGFTYEQILKHYYTGIQLINLY